MEVVILNTPSDVAKYGANLCSELLKRKPRAVLGLATGSTPVAMYAELARRYKAKQFSFRQVRSFNLDEYVGLAPDHPQSYRFFMEKYFFGHIDILPKNTFLPESFKANPLMVGKEYEKKIRLAG